MEITNRFIHKGLATPESHKILIAVGDAALDLFRGFPVHEYEEEGD